MNVNKKRVFCCVRFLNQKCLRSVCCVTPCVISCHRNLWVLVVAVLHGGHLPVLMLIIGEFSEILQKYLLQNLQSGSAQLNVTCFCKNLVFSRWSLVSAKAGGNFVATALVYPFVPFLSSQQLVCESYWNPNQPGSSSKVRKKIPGEWLCRM